MPGLFQVIAATNPEEDVCASLKLQISVFRTVEDMLVCDIEEKAQHEVSMEVVSIAVPHNCYRQNVPVILSAGHNVLKEKPAAMTEE